MIPLRRKKKQPNEDREQQPGLYSFVNCRHCGQSIEIKNVEAIGEEFAVMCPRCHRRSFLSRASLQQSRR